MSETREASWYEIALTHSQVVKIFVGLLLCLVGAFFSGIWIGRDAVNAVESVPAPAFAPAANGDAVEGREVAQLNFFSADEVVPDGGAAKAAPAGAESTLAEDVGATASAPTAGETGPASAPASRPAQASPGGPDAAVEVTREPVPGAPAPSGDLVVQVFSSNDATQARRVLGRLAQGGHPAYLSPVDVDGRTMYRVRIGPYAEREQAEQVADNVRRAFKLDTWITQKSS